MSSELSTGGMYVIVLTDRDLKYGTEYRDKLKNHCLEDYQLTIHQVRKADIIISTRGFKSCVLKSNLDF